ncbi:MAG: c-type cytochrome [Ginsengibacter sp.]
MKNIGMALCTVIILASCGGDDKTKNDSATTDTIANASAPVEPAADPEVAKGLDLAAKSDCFTCHKLNETSIGPSYAAVAAKYKSQMPAIADTLVSKIIKGGSGNWGAAVMTAHPMLSKEDAKSIVTYVMSIQ